MADENYGAPGGLENYYSLLGVSEAASSADIKKAFRENAKRLHPDIAGEEAAEKMRKLLAAYKILSDSDRRNEYDRVFTRLRRKYSFDYRVFLREQEDDPVSRAKLVFFELFHLEEDEAISIWESEGGLLFPLEKYLDREDWMDCSFILAEELAVRERVYEALVLLVRLVREERRKPYFRHFMEDIEIFLKDLARRLKPAVNGSFDGRIFVDNAVYLECMGALLGLGFSPRDEARWLRSMAGTLALMGEESAASKLIKEALSRDPGHPGTARRRVLHGAEAELCSKARENRPKAALQREN